MDIFNVREAAYALPESERPVYSLFEKRNVGDTTVHTVFTEWGPGFDSQYVETYFFKISSGLDALG